MSTLTVRQAAQLLGVTPAQVHYYLDDGRLHGEFAGNRTLVCKSCTHYLATIRTQILKLWKAAYAHDRACGWKNETAGRTPIATRPGARRL